MAKDGARAHDIEPPRTWDDPFLDALEQVPPGLAFYRDSRRRREALFMLKCLRLAPNLEIMEALMRGEKVPIDRLDPYWVKELGLR